jgi:hypothetical protein
MTHVETKVTLSINPNRMNLEELEQEIGKVLQQAGQELILQACQIMEDQLMEQEKGRYRRDKRRLLHLLTRFGWIRLQRWQARTKEGWYCRPLDELLGLEPRQHASPWIIEQAVALATRLPYRQATYLLSNFVEAPIDHRSLYRWVQKTGAEIVLEEDELQQAVFRDGVIPPRDLTQREIILAKVDATCWGAPLEESDRFEVRLGVLTTGKELESQTARHRRYRLQERVRYGGVETAEQFGERLFLKGEARLGISHAHHLLLVGDGAEWIEALAGHDRWRATYQIDWWHLTHAFHRTFPELPRLVQRLKRDLYCGQGDKIIPAVRLAKLNGIGDPEQVDKLLTYLEANQGGFYGARSLRPQISSEARLVCVEGSGAVEKHIDLAICRRFKGQGMRWTRKGANRLLKLRIKELDRAA